MRIVLPFTLFLVACGPSKLDEALAKCRAASDRRDWDNAIAECNAAQSLDRLSPQGEQANALWLAAMQARAWRDFDMAEAQRRRDALAEDREILLRRQTHAAEDQAAALKER